MIALSIFRQLATRRPVGFWGQNALRIGSIRCHNVSGISQIVPKGLRFALRRFMATAPLARVDHDQLSHKSLMQWAFRRFSDSFLVPVEQSRPSAISSEWATPAE
jgi:hypothetical protein